MRRHATILTVLTLLFLAACGPMPSGEEGSFVSISIPLTNDECGVVSARATVTAPDVDPVGPIDLDVDAETISGLIPDVVAGADREVSVEALDQTDLVVYAGSGTVEVLEGETASLDLVLYRNFQNCPDEAQTGSISLNGTLDNTDYSGPVYPIVFDQAEMDVNGVIYFFDREGAQVHRFDAASEELLSPLPGSDAPTAMAIHPGGFRVYLAYDGGRIDFFDTATGEGSFFAAAPDSVSSMLVCEPFLFTIDASGAWDTHTLFDLATGAQVASDDWRDTAASLVWAPGLSRLFFINSGVSPTDINMVDIDGANGTLGPEVDSPYHGDFSLLSPIRILPDESAVVVASGNIFSTADLTHLTSFGLEYVDLAFHHGNYFLIQENGETTQLVVLGPGFDILSAHYYEGTARRLFTLSNELVLVTGLGEGAVAIQRIVIADL